MQLRNKLGLGLVFVSFALLYLGLSEPMLTINLSTKVVTNLGQIDADVLNKTRSIMGTVIDLYDSDKLFVAFLIFLFSIIVPVVKGILLLAALLGRGRVPAAKLVEFVRRIGKWSMADVMVVAVFIAFLSTRYDESVVSKQLAVFGMQIKIDIMNQMLSTLGPGFYWFTAYCLVSLFALEFIEIEESS